MFLNPKCPYMKGHGPAWLVGGPSNCGWWKENISQVEAGDLQTKEPAVCNHPTGGQRADKAEETEASIKFALGAGHIHSFIC